VQPLPALAGPIARRPPSTRKVCGVICTRQFADDPRKAHLISARAASSSAVASDIDAPGFVSRGRGSGVVVRYASLPQPLPGAISTHRSREPQPRPACCFGADRFLSRCRGGADCIDTPRIRQPTPEARRLASARTDSSAVAEAGLYRHTGFVSRRPRPRGVTLGMGQFLSGCQQARSARSTRAGSAAARRTRSIPNSPEASGTASTGTHPTGAPRIRQRL
jgi:hypothetical protein